MTIAANIQVGAEVRATFYGISSSLKVGLCTDNYLVFK
jgi:hypothetical protein